MPCLTISSCRALEGENEIIVFADSELKERTLKEFDPSSVKVSKTSFLAALPLRISNKGSPKVFFETALKMWKANKTSMRVTFRAAKGNMTLELSDSTVPQVERILSQMN